MPMTTSTTTTVDLQGQVTVAELSAVLQLLPASGVVRFQVHPGDQRDPSYTTLTVTHRGERRG